MNKIEFKKLISNKVIILDGALGTELQNRGFLNNNNPPEELNIKDPKKIQEIHRDYCEAGSEIILTNTFGANRIKLSEYNLTDKINEINHSGVKIAREIAQKYNAFVAGDIGPIGEYLEPLGNITFEKAYEIFSEQVKALAKAKPDLLIIETMAEIREVKASLLAAKDNFTGPVIVSMTFTPDGSSVTGTDILVFFSIVESMEADAIGMNCSSGPKEMLNLVNKISKYTSIPILFKPNAGMPVLINRQTKFPGNISDFVDACEKAYHLGVRLLGGCCGTNPEFIRALSSKLKDKKPIIIKPKKYIFISSRTKVIDLAKIPDIIIIGERINPTNRKDFQEEILKGNFSTLRKEAIEQTKAGASILDINTGLPGVDEPQLMKRFVQEVQEIVHTPLCLDTSSIEALEEGLKTCAGKPIINSVNGEDKKLKKILPLAKRYGAAVIALTMDSKGIPKNFAQRLHIAANILQTAIFFKIPESDIIIDYLTLSVSAMPDQAKETLKAIKESKKRWPYIKTVLGISNISFGMPNRHIINSTFLNLAKEAGLDIAILNPYQDWSINDPYARQLLLGNDPGGQNYIRKYGQTNTIIKQTKKQTSLETQLYDSIITGSKETISELIIQILKKNIPPIEIVNSILLKALEEVGEKFKNKIFFLPQVIRSAEATQEAFKYLRPLLVKDAKFKQGKIILATVKGDVHDIGKNIVGAVLESHGWEVIDLGKNVDEDTILKTAKRSGAQIIGLSALMTTTMIEMENVINKKFKLNMNTKIIVGGAPVTESFAKEIKADGYAKDAIEAAELVKSLIKI